MNDEDVKDVKTIEQIIKKCRKNDKKHVKVVFGTIDKVSLHPSYGVPQMNFDQLNVVRHHIHQIKGLKCQHYANGNGISCTRLFIKANATKHFTKILQQRQD